MPPLRQELTGAPHTYYVRVQGVLGHRLFTERGETDSLLALVERLRTAFDARIFAYLVQVDGLQIVLRHHGSLAIADDRLRARWLSIGGNPLTPVARIKQRFTTLGGYMQTLLQRFSRDWNRRHRSRGHLWAGRYRACLLADDAALLAATAWLEDAETHRHHAAASSRGERASAQTPVRLAQLPIRVGPDDSLFPTDDSPPGLVPASEELIPQHFARFVAQLDRGDLAAYGAALSNGWALGRPESLSESVSRLGRASGRGRSRQLRELDDHLGLCGVWG